MNRSKQSFKMKPWQMALGAIGLAVGVAAVEAAVIYDNGATVNAATRSDTHSVFVAGPQFSADDFILMPGANTIADVHWRGVYAFSNSPEADDFTIEIYADAGGVPAIAPLHAFAVGNAVNRADTGVNLSTLDIFSYSVNIAPVTLAAGIPFWLSIFNNTISDPDDDWQWGAQDMAGNSAERATTTGGWAPSGDRLDFQLTSVPEPATLALLGLALAGLGWMRRRGNR